jgi:small-conductance mechanosensitive channel
VLTALGVGGLAVALALQDTLANVFAGIHIILAKDISPGEFVRLDSGQEGFVENIGWRNTTIRTLPNDLVVVPNSKLSAAVVTNLSRPSPSHPLLVPCSVAYGSDLERVEAVALRVAGEVLAATEGGVPSEPPVVRFAEFADSGVNFNVILRVKDFPARFLVRHAFIKALHAAFLAENITIPYPTRTVIHQNAHA